MMYDAGYAVYDVFVIANGVKQSVDGNTVKMSCLKDIDKYKVQNKPSILIKN